MDSGAVAALIGGFVGLGTALVSSFLAGRASLRQAAQQIDAAKTKDLREIQRQAYSELVREARSYSTSSWLLSESLGDRPTEDRDKLYRDYLEAWRSYEAVLAEVAIIGPPGVTEIAYRQSELIASYSNPLYGWYWSSKGDDEADQEAWRAEFHTTWDAANDKDSGFVDAAREALNYYEKR